MFAERKNTTIGCFLICLLLVSTAVHAQLKAGFTANKTQGCAPLLVQFTDTSTGTPTSWRWDLGNGTISFLQNPAATYFQPGRYSIKLVVKTGAETDSIVKQQYITVFAIPNINFIASDSIGCYPLGVQFTDRTDPAGSPIASWLWDFGDGDTSSLQNPQHVYTTLGNYNVSLLVKNINGCTKSLTKNNYIKLPYGVKANFTAGGATTCTPPTPIQFTNSSSGTGTISYRWDFGDGSNSTLANPTHNYTAAGSYNVRLIATNNNGCADTLLIPNAISIGSVSANFSLPSQACAGAPVAFVNNSSPAPGTAIWTFSDGSVINSIHATKVFQTGGIYSVKLLSDFGACKDSITKSITILDKPLAAASSSVRYACKPPFTANFTNSSTGAISYKWYFGDGDSSTLATPSHIYQNYGSYSVVLIAYNANGCTDTLKLPNYIRVEKPIVKITGVPMEGCLPRTLTAGVEITTPVTIASYQWDFGDGGSSTAANPSYTYTKAGVYTVRLIYFTIDGCSDTLQVNSAVKVGNKPIVNFTATPQQGCAFKPISFKDLSTGALGDQWLWSFGEGGTSPAQNPQYIYQDTGYFKVSLVVTSNGCSDSLSIPNFIYIKAPIARFRDSLHCSDRLTRWFKDLSIDAKEWYWQFGDGSSSTDANPSHKYASPGQYFVTLTVKNDTCEHSLTQQVVVINEASNFTAEDTTVCKGRVVHFEAASRNNPFVTEYYWSFGDGREATSATPTTVYYSNGIYDVQLITIDRYSCRDTTVKTQYMQVFGPTASFSVNTPPVCTNTTIHFADASTSDGTNPLKRWIWNYGDGKIDTLLSGPFSHLYSTAGNYNVQLMVEDTLGCLDVKTVYGQILISKPSVNFSTVDTLSCVGAAVPIFNASFGNGPISYQWSYGNGSGSNLQQPVIRYNAEGSYTVKVIATDVYGCKDSLERISYISIKNPVAALKASDTLATCPPLVVNFTNQSLNFNKFEWDFGDATGAMISNPIHFYNTPGVFKSKIIVTSPGGCTDTAFQNITVRGPQGSFNYSVYEGCEPTTIPFKGITKDTVTFIWDFNDGSVIQTSDSLVNHTYSRIGTYLPRMILRDPAGCQVVVSGVDTVHIYGAAAKFGLSSQVLCDSGFVQFTDSTVSNDLVTGRKWKFGDGTESSDLNPSHFYKKTGNYPIQLIVNTARGCSDTASIQFPISIVNSPKIDIVGDSSGCIPSTASFSGVITVADTSQLSWNWDFGNGLGSSIQNPTGIVYGTAGTYSVKLITVNSSGCADTTLKVFQALPVPVVEAGADLTACLNSPVQLQASGATTYQWTQNSSLSCTNCAGPLAIPQQTTRYYVLGTNEVGCSKTDSVLVRVQQPQKLSASAGDTICVGSVLQLNASGTDRYNWSPAAGLSGVSIANPKASPTVTTVYQVIGADSNGCFKDTAYIPIQVYNYPKVDLGADLQLSVGTSLTLKPTYSSDVSKYTWTPALGLSCSDCPTPIAQPKQTTVYKLEVSNLGSCTSSDEVTINVFCNNANIFVPNTFSPNGDGANDVFYPRGHGLYIIRYVRVYNRLGEAVFEKSNFLPNDMSAGWNGSFKGKAAAQDVYVYTMEIVCENNTVIRYHGNVSLIR